MGRDVKKVGTDWELFEFYVGQNHLWVGMAFTLLRISHVQK